MKRILLVLAALSIFSSVAFAQGGEPAPCSIGSSTATIGQVITATKNGKFPTCSWQASGGGGGTGTVTSVATGCGLTGGPITTTGTIADSVATAAHNGTYAILTGDCGKSLTTNTAAAWTIARAGTGGFEAGKYWVVNNVGAGSLTVTATTSTFYGGPSANISGSVLTVPTLTSATIISDGTNYQVLSGGGGGGTLPSTPVAASLIVGNSGTTTQKTYNAQAYGVLADTQYVFDASIVGTTVTCADCNFTAADIGKIAFATENVTSSGLVLRATTISGVSSGTVATVAHTVEFNFAPAVFVWGHDDTTALGNAFAASSATCGTLQLSQGNSLVSTALFIVSSNSKCGQGTGNYPAADLMGVGIASSWLIPVPNFDFTTCLGGSSSHACFGGLKGGRYHDFTIWGGGYDFSDSVYTAPPVTTNLFEVNDGDGIYQVDLEGWSNGHGTCLYNTGFGQSLFYQGGAFSCGEVSMDVSGTPQCASSVGSYFTGTILIETGGCLGSFNDTYDGAFIVSGQLYAANDHFRNNGNFTPYAVGVSGGGSFWDGGGNTVAAPYLCGGGSCPKTPGTYNTTQSFGLVPQTDTFIRADGGLGANWTTNGSSAPKIVSNQVVQNAPGDVSMAHWSALSAAQSPDQTACVVVQAGWGAAAVRMDSSAATGYLGIMNASGTIFALFKDVAGTLTQLATRTLGTSAYGKEVCVGVIGTTVYGWTGASSASILTATDSAIATGSPGLVVYNSGVITGWSASYNPPNQGLGVGAPSGSCINGSSYQRIDGGAGTSFYICESGSWVGK